MEFSAVHISAWEFSIVLCPWRTVTVLLMRRVFGLAFTSFRLATALCRALGGSASPFPWGVPRSLFLFLIRNDYLCTNSQVLPYSHGQHWFEEEEPVTVFSMLKTRRRLLIEL